MDIKVQQAREHHARSLEKEAEAGRERDQRDRLIRQLRGDDPKRWSYGALAKAVGCSPELIAYIITGRKKALRLSASDHSDRAQHPRGHVAADESGRSLRPFDTVPL